MYVQTELSPSPWTFLVPPLIDAIVFTTIASNKSSLISLKTFYCHTQLVLGTIKLSKWICWPNLVSFIPREPCLPNLVSCCPWYKLVPPPATLKIRANSASLAYAKIYLKYSTNTKQQQSLIYCPALVPRLAALPIFFSLDTSYVSSIHSESGGQGHPYTSPLGAIAESMSSLLRRTCGSFLPLSATAASVVFLIFEKIRTFFKKNGPKTDPFWQKGP